MKQIKEIVANIREELEGAEHYAKLATQYKTSDKTLAETYIKMAEAELGHVSMLHEQAVRLIKEHKAAGSEAPAAVQAVWDWEHEKMVDHVVRIKTMLSMYRQ